MTDAPGLKDWSSGKRLFRLRSAGVPLSELAEARLQQILLQHPDWKFEESERAEFSIWTGSFVGERGDPAALKGISPSEILIEARQKAQADRFAYGGLWRNFTQENPAEAFEALRARASEDDIESDEWQQLFFKLREETSNRELDAQVLAFLDQQDLSKFSETSEAIISWLKDKRQSLESLSDGWARVLRIWDRIAAEVQDSPSEPSPDVVDDIIMAVLNSTPGSLIELLVQRLTDQKLKKGAELPDEIADRLTNALRWPAADGLIAQCALMQRLPWLEYIAPSWTWANLVPLLQTDADYLWPRWQARFYHTSLGSKELFSETKTSFLNTFMHSEKMSRSGGQVLLLVRAAYKATRPKSNWEFVPSEARTAVASGGPGLMIEITRVLRHRSDEDSPEEHWHKVVSPILDFLWPRDAKLQSKGSSLGLIRLMLDAGSAFPDAVARFLPFIRPWDEERPWEFEYIFDADAVKLLEENPIAAIRLLDVHVGQDAVPRQLNEILDRIERADKSVGQRDDFSAMRGLARRSAA